METILQLRYLAAGAGGTVLGRITTRRNVRTTEGSCAEFRQRSVRLEWQKRTFKGETRRVTSCPRTILK